MIRRTTKLMIEGAAAAVGGVVVLVAVAVWLFSSGPISIDFLTPYIEAALATPDGTLRLKFDRTLLAWEGWERTIDMRATHVRAYDDKGRLVATFPEIALNLSARALVHGVVAPSMLEVVGAQVRLKRDANGQFELAFSLPEGGSQAGAAALPIPLPHLPVQSDKGPSGVVPMMLQELLHSPDPDKPTGYLRRVSVRDADLVVDDSHWDTSWKAKLSRLSLERDARSIRGTAAIDVVVEGDTSHFLLNGLYHDASSAVALDIGFANVRPALFARAIPILEPLARLKLPLDGTVATRLGLAGGLDQLSFQVMGGPGAVAVPELYPEDVALSNFEARGSLGENATSITLDTMRLDLGGPVITIAGTASGLAGNSRVALDLSVKDVPVDDLAQRWPTRVAPYPRGWITTNLSGGKVDDLHLTTVVHGHAFDADSYSLDKLAGTMRVTGVDVHYLGKMPKVRRVDADIAFDSKTFNVNPTRGSVEGLTLEGANIVITGLDITDQAIAIDLRASGALRDALTLVNYEPLGYATALGVDPAKFSGRALVHTHLAFPLIKDLRLAKVDVSADAKLSDVEFANAFVGHDLEKGELTLNVLKSGMDLAGRGKVGPVPVDIDWHEDFGERAERKIRLAGELDEAARQALGIDTSPLMAGPVPTVLNLKAAHHKTEDIELALDLSKASLTIPRFDWHKDPGVPGAARLSLAMKGDRPELIRRFDIAAGDLVARGSAVLVPQGNGMALARLAFDRLDFGQNRVAGSFAPRPGGGYDVTVTGAQLDVSPLLKDAERAVPGTVRRSAPKGLELDISLDVGKLWITPSHRQALLAVKGTLHHDGERVSRAALTAEVEGATAVSFGIAPETGGRVLVIASDNAGAVLRSFGIIENIAGGALDVTGHIDDTRPDAPMRGVFKISNYRVMDAPVFARVLTLASFVGIADQLGGQGIGMSTFNAPFAKFGDRIDLNDGRAVGSEIGVTFDGAIDLDSQLIDLGGTVVPVYSLNSLLGNIPLIGDIFVGKKGSGMFAASYRAIGNLDQPNVSVNPLSALAPGILRGFVDLLDGPPPDKSFEPPAPRPPVPEARDRRF